MKAIALLAALASPAFAEGKTTHHFEVHVTGLDDKPTTYKLTLADGEPGHLRAGENMPYGENAPVIGFDFRLSSATHDQKVQVTGDLDVTAQGPKGSIIHRATAKNTVTITQGTPTVFTSGTDTLTKKRYEITIDETK